MTQIPAWSGTPAPWSAPGSSTLPAGSDSHDQSAHQLTLAAALSRLTEQGGWQGALAPRAAWQRALGERCPYPDDAVAFAALPTFGPLDRLLLDDQITDVHINGPGREVLLRRSGSAAEWGMGTAWHAEWLPWLAQQLAGRGSGQHGRLHLSGTADASRPGRPACRLRYQIVLPPACLHGPSITIRVLRPGCFSLQRLIEQGMLSLPIAALLTGCAEAGINLVIAGTPGTGKTTLLRVLLAQEQLADLRLLCLEDVPELMLDSPASVQLIASPEHSLLQLTYAAQRMNPARLVLGELRGAEAYALLAAMRSGSPVLTTIHGLSAGNALDALIGMALEAPESRGSLDLVRMNLNNLPLLLVVLRREHGLRRVCELAELVPGGSAHHPLPQIRWRWAPEAHDWQLVSPPSASLLAQLREATSPATRALLQCVLEGEPNDHSRRL